MIVRNFEQRDISQLLRINANYPKHRLTHQRMQDFLSRHGACLVAEEEKAILGFLLLAKGPSAARLIDVQVAPTHLDGNATHLLCESAYELLRKEDVPAIYK